MFALKEGKKKMQPELKFEPSAVNEISDKDKRCTLQIFSDSNLLCDLLS
jgi:hypothetical protein